jgi:hypothetical protein
MRRGMLVLAVVFLAAGCGEEPGPSAAKDRRAVQVRAATYVRAYLAGDGERACRQFTPTLRRVSELRAKQGGLTCASALALVGPQLLEAVPADQRDAFRKRASNPGSVHVELAGDRATAGFAPSGGGRAPMRLELARVGKRWLVDKLGTRAQVTP